MDDKQMREAFAARDAWMAEIKAAGHPPPSIAERASFIDGFTRGRAAGMERAAGGCDEIAIRAVIGSAEEQTALACANRIRDEIPGDRNG